MINRLIFFLAIAAFPFLADAQTAPTFCSGSDIDMTPTSETCLTTCTAVAGRSASYLSSNTAGYCVGQASYSKFIIYRLMLGQNSSGSEAKCTIWSGTLPVTLSSKSAGDTATGGPIDLSSCANGTYDTLHIVTGRVTEFAGNTVFPNASGTGSSPSMVRTTSTKHTGDTGRETGTTLTTITNWLETSTSHSTTSLNYVRPTASWNTAYKKLGTATSSTNLSSSNDEVMYYDELKGAVLNNDTSHTRTGWLCEDAAATLCYRAYPADETEMETRIVNTVDAVVGLPITLTDDNKCNLNLTPSYYASSRSGSEELGVKFLWYNDAGTLKYVGAYPGESGLYVTVGAPSC